MSSFMSIYIPYIHNRFDYDFVVKIFEEYGIGKVNRVDFFSNGKWNWSRSAFVHLEEWYYNSFTDKLYPTLESGDYWTLNVAVYGPDFWILKKMLSRKIPDTKLNIHQLAAKMEKLKADFDELAFKVAGPLDVLDEEYSYDLVKDIEERDDNYDYFKKNNKYEYHQDCDYYDYYAKEADCNL